MSTMVDAVRVNDLLQASLDPAEGDAIPLPRRPARNVYLVLKCVLDFSLAGLLLLVTGPVLLLCALLVKLTSRGPAFYSQIRLGLGGRPYWIYKLRTMYHLAEAKSGAKWSQAGDPRVTPLGRFLRRSHLDELPQLINILRGEMSLVGPRPERPEFIPALTKAVPLYAARMLVLPGVTGLAQVQLPADTDIESVRNKVAYDLHYIRQASLWLDLRILAATGFKVLGASFAFLRRTFLLPSRAVVESDIPQPEQGAPAGSLLPGPAAAPINPELVPAP
jgi:lipopolysaccharide/colanic/teichoic acid biosynthesis glycosyltransferase